MTQKHYKTLKDLADLADGEMKKFISTANINTFKKFDKTIATSADFHLDAVLSTYANCQGLNVISEEGDKSMDICRGGNYITIDPIDGTGGFVKFIKYKNTINQAIELLYGKDPLHDHCFLSGIVENGEPKAGIIHSYTTKDRIYVDNKGIVFLPQQDQVISRINKTNNKAHYLGSRYNNLYKDFDGIRQGSGAFRMTLVQANPYHNHALSLNDAQKAGIWDVIPAYLCSQHSKGKVLDGDFKKLKFDKYITIPGQGVHSIKGVPIRKIKKYLK